MQASVYFGTMHFPIGLWTLPQTMARHESVKLPAVKNSDVSSDKVAAMPEHVKKQLSPRTESEIGNNIISDDNTDMKSTGVKHEEDSLSLRTYGYIYDKILYRIMLGFQCRNLSTWSHFLEQSNSSNSEACRPMERSKFWAVLIGIDCYESYPLQGCVSDALLMERYLKEDLGVPQERIQLLLGSQYASSKTSSFPSRANIIDAFLSLIHNPQIEVGDNIIIYFSGHGSGYSLKEYYLRDADSDDVEENPGTVDESIEAICPIDRDTMDSRGLRVPDISDREINAIFRQISCSKGYRITFILDCCHSGTHTRHFPEPGTRTIPPLPRSSLRRMLHMVDENLDRYPSYESVLGANWRPDMSSHVILAACKEYQTAKEVESETVYNGVFTRALIDTLRSGNLSKESTYVDLIFSLPWSRGQTPVVAGNHKWDRLWYKDQ
ncbi:caspase domain-containing protein [Desarmillaria tabescens]|uniref:Caspase domain-containing protein n=1 Tax=Armillaria tabescens TaxID=1929756 RepID=A0AA39N7H3_ARMTA|nr:caspase domain-containing protein [Desarmillaria tabescens]KAK0460449.1 caspase domain-containing protein [Desarmillaria tabescens]